MAAKLLITQRRSYIGSKPKQRATLRALGLRKMNSQKVHEDNPVVRGMINVVRHMIEVKEIKE
jgi:large subunit ribosomal protein L30